MLLIQDRLEFYFKHMRRLLLSFSNRAKDSLL